MMNTENKSNKPFHCEDCVWGRYGNEYMPEGCGKHTCAKDIWCDNYKILKDRNGFCDEFTGEDEFITFLFNDFANGTKEQYESTKSILREFWVDRYLRDEYPEDVFEEVPSDR